MTPARSWPLSRSSYLRARGTADFKCLWKRNRLAGSGEKYLPPGRIDDENYMDAGAKDRVQGVGPGTKWRDYLPGYSIPNLNQPRKVRRGKKGYHFVRGGQGCLLQSNGARTGVAKNYSRFNRQDLLCCEWIASGRPGGNSDAAPMWSCNHIGSPPGT